MITDEQLQGLAMDMDQPKMPRCGQRVRIYTTGCEWFYGYFVEGGRWLVWLHGSYIPIPSADVDTWECVRDSSENPSRSSGKIVANSPTGGSAPGTPKP